MIPIFIALIFPIYAWLYTHSPFDKFPVIEILFPENFHPILDMVINRFSLGNNILVDMETARWIIGVGFFHSLIFEGTFIQCVFLCLNIGINSIMNPDGFSSEELILLFAFYVVMIKICVIYRRLVPSPTTTFFLISD